jgi:uncharacterized iron-regulated membrane protein
MKNNSSPSPKPRNRLLAQSRQWHKWGGLFAGLCLLIVGSTGIVLNYKRPIFTALGLERDRNEKTGAMMKAERSENRPGKLTTAGGLSAATVSMDAAFALARETWGDVPLERIELKDDHGELVYKIKRRDGDELWVNATTGSHFVKAEYERVKSAADGKSVTRSTDWGKIMLDLHTGKIGGEVGKAVMTFVAVVLLLLTLSGVYMWLKPLLIRRENARAKARLPVRSEVLVPTIPPSQMAKRELAEV